MKFRKIKAKVWKDIHIRTSSVSNLVLLTASWEIFAFLKQLPFFMATSKTWTRSLDLGPEPWTRTLDPGPWTLDPDPDPGLWTRTLDSDPEKPGS